MPTDSSAAARTTVVSRQVPARPTKTSSGVRIFCSYVQHAGGLLYAMSRLRAASQIASTTSSTRVSPAW